MVGSLDVDTILAYNVLHGPPDPPDSSAGDTEDATAKERLRRCWRRCCVAKVFLAALQVGGPLAKGRSRGWPASPLCWWPFADPTWFHIRCKHSDWRLPEVWDIDDIAGAEFVALAPIQHTLNSQAPGTRWLCTDHGGPSQLHSTLVGARPFVLATCWRESRGSISSQEADFEVLLFKFHVGHVQ